MNLPFVIALVVVFIIELVLSSNWSRFYFSVGIRLFRLRMPRVELHRLSSRWLTQQHHHANLAPLRFNRLGKTAIAWREGVGSLHYTPILHGVLRRAGPKEGGTLVVGYLNWFTGLLVGGLLVGDVLRFLNGNLGFPTGGVLLVVVIMLYAFQVSRLLRMARMVAERLDHARLTPSQADGDNATNGEESSEGSRALNPADSGKS